MSADEIDLRIRLAAMRLEDGDAVVRLSDLRRSLISVAQQYLDVGAEPEAMAIGAVVELLDLDSTSNARDVDGAPDSDAEGP